MPEKFKSEKEALEYVREKLGIKLEKTKECYQIFAYGNIYHTIGVYRPLSDNEKYRDVRIVITGPYSTSEIEEIKSMLQKISQNRKLTPEEELVFEDVINLCIEQSKDPYYAWVVDLRKQTVEML